MKRNEEKPPFDGSFPDMESIFGDFFGGAGKSQGRGADVRVNTSLSLDEASHGLTKTLQVPHETTCEPCHGRGASPGATFEACAACRGRGQTLRTEATLRASTRCEACRGKRGRWVPPCDLCDGEGFIRATREVKVTVPPGVRPGQRLRLGGLGRTPLPDARAEDGSPARPGDLYVVLDIDLPPGLTIEGDDLVFTVRLDPEQARRGTVLDVPWVEGSAHVEVPAGTAHGARVVRRGWGLTPLNLPFTRPPDDQRGPFRANDAGPRGDLIVVVHTTDPEEVLPDERAGSSAPRSISHVRVVAFGLAIATAVLGYLLSR